MNWNAYTWIFITALVLHHGLETVLAVLQLRHLRTRRKRVPKHLLGKVSLETIQKAVLYNTEKLRFGLLSRYLEMLPLFAMVFWGFDWIDLHFRQYELGDIFTGLLLIGTLSLAGSILSLPGNLYFTFVIEQKHGFNKQSVADFFIDKGKEFLVSTILGCVLLWLVLFVMESTPYWWIAAYAIILIFQTLMMWLYPLVIMPLFNKFVPVAGELANAVSILAQEVGFPLRGVVSMDGSRRSGHSNAFIIGFKGARRIVLYDTLIAKLSTSSLVAVLAHELGHYKLGHIKKRLLSMAFVGLGIFAGLYWMSLQPDMYTGLGFSTPSAYAALVVFGLIIGEVSFPFGFFSRVLSRRDEYAADRFAVEAMKNSFLLKDALITLTKQNLSSPGSHRWYRGYYNSHPSLRDRLRALDEHAKEKGYPVDAPVSGEVRTMHDEENESNPSD